MSRMRCLSAVAVVALCAISPSRARAQGAEDCVSAEAAPIVLDANGIAGVAGNFTGSLNDGPSGCGLTTNRTQWWTLIPDVSGVYNISLCGSDQIDTSLGISLSSEPCLLPATYLACNDDACGQASQITVNLTQGTMYRLRVATGSATVSNGGGYVVRVTRQAVNAPENDACGAATSIGGTSTAVPGTNSGSLTGPNLSSCGGNGDGNDVYFSFRPSNNSRHIISVCSDAMDASLSVHAACPVDAFTTNQLVGVCGQSDNSAPLCDGRGASVNAQLDPMLTYLIRVAGVSDNTGSTLPGFGAFSVQVEEVPFDRPENDACDTALDLASETLPFTHVVDARNAFDDLDPGSCNQNAVPNAVFGVWYKFTAPGSGLLRVVESSVNDVVTGIWTGPQCPVLGDAIRCADEESFTFPVTGATVYWIQVSSRFAAGPTTEYAVTFDFLPPPENDACDSALALTAADMPYSFVLNAADAQADTIAPTDCTNSSMASAGVWWTFTAPPSGGRVFLSETGINNDIAWAVYSGDCMMLAPRETMPPSPNCFTLDNSSANFVDVLPDETIIIGMWRQSFTVPVGIYTGSITFLAPPENEDCATALEVTGSFPVNNTLAETGATLNLIPCPDEIAPDTVDIHKDTWYRYTAPATGTLTTFFERSGGANNHRVAVYGASDCPTSAQMLAGCDVGDYFHNFEVLAGEVFYIQIGSATATSAAIGNMLLNLVPVVGSCCLPSGSCVMTTPAACAATMDATYNGDNSPCEAIDTMAMVRTFAGAGGTIPDSGGRTSVVTVEDEFDVGDVEVVLDMTHQHVGDLTILLSHEGRSATLVARTARGLSGDFNGAPNNLGGVYTFDDDALDTWWAQLTEITIPGGTYLPSDHGEVVTSLRNAFNGAPAEGDWVLSILDQAAGDSGLLSGWTLRLHPSGANACGDEEEPCPGDFDDSGMVDATDIFIFLDAWFLQIGQTGMDLSADIDGSGTVDATDIFIFLDIWFANVGVTCP